MPSSLPSLTRNGPKNDTLFGVSFLIVVVLIGIRLVTMDKIEWSNVTPMAAFAVCFGLFVPRFMMAACLALSGLFISDVVINLVHAGRNEEMAFWSLMISPTMLMRYLVFGGLLWGASRLRKFRSSSIAFACTPLATLGFYIIANTVAWASSAPPYAYAKTLAGWWQSQTVGLPGFMPSYLFLRNALAGDLIFTFAFVALVVWLPKSRDSLLNPAETTL